MRVAQRIRVRGVVQGVGFRPFVWRLARELDLAGWVRNDPAGVEISAEGAVLGLERLLARLRAEAPPLARIEGVDATEVASTGARDFRIETSGDGACATSIGPDAAPCEACLLELFSPGGRRYRHPFITCTHCGPRYTIAARLPYDRSRTSMGEFPLCDACAREYADPGDRRFHAEPIACLRCGPTLRFTTPDGAASPNDPIEAALRALQSGQIVAIKGLGGYHLACDARNVTAVAALRERKDRERKPFALMVANVASARCHAEVSGSAAEVLRSSAAPIVLAPRIAGRAEALPGVAPGMGRIGLMLPATPIQWLLFHEAAGRPDGLGWTMQAQPLVLVMTSANPRGEPLVTDDAEAYARLAGIADAFLVHDRRIVVRCDDSVILAGDGAPAHPRMVRRARGYVPDAIALGASGPVVVGIGAHLKSTICVSRDDKAYVSQHIGDLDTAQSIGFLEESLAHFLGLLDVRPVAVAHDLHPDMPSTRLAMELASDWSVPAIAVQHHHAHIGAVLAERGYRGPVLGLVLDGTGYGDDGAAWGGELLRIDATDAERIGHLAPLPLVGGDRAAREPWRMAAAVLHRLGRAEDIARRFPRQPLAATLADYLQRSGGVPLTTSMGRVFDAAAALLGTSDVAAYEAEAAMRLEALAGDRRSSLPEVRALSAACQVAHGVPDFTPLLAVLADWRGEVGAGAALFHSVAAAVLASWVVDAAASSGLREVALAGGCFLNVRLATELRAHLRAAGIEVLEPTQVPVNDASISLGQVWVVRNRLERMSCV